MESVSTFHGPIFYTFREISHQRAFDGFDGSGQSIVLNNSASPKMVIKMFFLKVLELFECRQGDPYMTAIRNFVRFAHS